LSISINTREDTLLQLCGLLSGEAIRFMESFERLDEELRRKVMLQKALGDPVARLLIPQGEHIGVICTNPRTGALGETARPRWEDHHSVNV
jgi:hypothetical protein